MSQGRGDMGVLPQKIFGWNGVKSYNVRQINMEIALSWKQGIFVYDGRRDNPFELGGDSDFSNFNTMFNTGERSEPENYNKNKIKIPPPPLWIRACKIQSI